MSMVLFNVAHCFVGPGRGYIYILYSKFEHQMYIGQTCDHCGVIGRLADHVSAKGTFRMRLRDVGVSLDDITDLHVFAYHLPDDPRFNGIDRAYREGVEHLVQKQLQQIRGELRPYMKIVSRVDYNPSAALPFVHNTAKQIIDEFLSTFQASITTTGHPKPAGTAK